MLQLLQGDCLELMAGIPDNSIDLIATDPPYFRVKGEAWDRQWDDADRFIAWIGDLCREWRRILKPNGSLYVFASPQMSARVEVEIGRHFNVLNSIIWRKEQGRHKGSCKDALRGYFPQTERVIFAEHYGADNMAKGESGYALQCDKLRGFLFEPLRAYLDDERKRAGIEKADVNAACGFSRSAGGMASRHYFSRSQWCLPTREHYEAMQRLFNANGGDYLKREYDYLKREYDDLKREYDELRRPFDVTAEVPYTDVWDFKTVGSYKGKHPCEKPAAMMEHIVRTSSRPGDTVLDCFAGSGVTGHAALNTGRKFIGIEKDPGYFAIARQRIESALHS